MATPNYGYEKRQRELAKKKKKEEKLRAKATERRPDNFSAGEQGGSAPHAQDAANAPDGGAADTQPQQPG